MAYLPYIFDLLVVIAIGGACVAGYKKGLVMATLGFLPMVGALISVKFLTPVAGKLLRGTSLFGSLAKSIENGLQLDAVIGEAAMESQTALIQNMALPNFLKDSLLENNNPVIYDLLDVEGIQAYISGFLANVCINIVSVILVFVLAFFALRFILKALNLVSRLPVLNFFNRISGFLVGGAKGLCMIWLVGIALTFFQLNARFQEIFIGLSQSVLALFLYENNLLLYFILTIFT